MFIDYWLKFKTLIISFTLLISIFYSTFFTVGEVNLVFAVSLIAALGIPHGALDYQLLQIIFPRTRPLIVSLIYMTLSIIVVVAWILFPIISLVSFLIISAYHFGGDWPINIPRRLLAGIFLIGLPSVFYPEYVLGYFYELSTSSDLSFLISALQLITFISLIYLSILFLFRQISGSFYFELMVLAFLAWATPPLTYFCVYFCFFHSLKHFTEISQLLEVNSLFSMYKLAVPITLITLAIGYLCFHILSVQFEIKLNKALLQTLFVGLAALTVPHMLLVEKVRLR